MDRMSRHRFSRGGVNSRTSINYTANGPPAPTAERGETLVALTSEETDQTRGRMARTQVRRIKKRMPRFLNDFVIPALNDGRYKDKLRWIDEAESIFVVRWQHKSTTTWNEEDTVVFQDWDKLKGHFNPHNRDYLTKSKQRFRAALYKLTNIIELSMPRFSKEENFRCYQILGIDKKSKRIREKRVRRRRYRSPCPVDQKIPFSPLPQKVPFSPSTKEVACSPMKIKEEQDSLSPRAQQVPTPPTQELSSLLDPHFYELSLESIHSPPNYPSLSNHPSKEQLFKCENDYSSNEYWNSFQYSNFPFEVSLHSTPSMYKSYDSYSELYSNGVVSSGFYNMDCCDKDIYSYGKDQDFSFHFEDVKLFL